MKVTTTCTEPAPLELHIHFRSRGLAKSETAIKPHEVGGDDFKVTHTKSNIIQASEYYPFGMQTASSWTRENSTGNNFLANGGTELNTTSQLYDLDFRNYDPALGRMNQVDPMAAKYATLSPYNYSFNNPVSYTDGNGADPQYENWNDYTGPGSTNDGYGDGSMMGMWATRYVWSGYINGTYTGYDVALNLGGAIWNGRAGMNDLDGWMGYSSAAMSGTSGEWHQIRANAAAVGSGMMSLDEYAARHGSGMSFNDGMVALASYNEAVYQGKLAQAQATYTAASSGFFSPYPAMMSAFANLLRESAVFLTVSPAGIPGYAANPLYKAEAVYWDAGWSFIGQEGDEGGFLILTGEQAGEIHEFTEKTLAGIGADAGVGFEIGRVDIYGRDESSFTSSHFYGFRDKVWASGSFPLPYLPPVLITGSVTLASTVGFYDGATVVAASIGLGVGIGPSKYMGGWNQGIIEKKKN